jgi:hypothetical protein
MTTTLLFSRLSLIKIGNKTFNKIFNKTFSYKLRDN